MAWRHFVISARAKNSFHDSIPANPRTPTAALVCHHLKLCLHAQPPQAHAERFLAAVLAADVAALASVKAEAQWRSGGARVRGDGW